MLGHRLLTLAIPLLVGLTVNASSALAQPGDDDLAPDMGEPATVTTADKVHYGVALRVRNVRVPESLLELFVEDAPGGVSQPGIGLEFSRRKGNFELQLGLEYDSIKMNDGVWIEQDKPIPQNEPDFVEFEGFGWVSIEVSFINHTKLAKNFFLRYGGGAGLAILKGDIVRTDYACTTDDPDSCGPYAGAENVRTPYDLKTPVIPIINALIGFQYRAGDNLFFNVEGGIRTLPFFGLSAGYYF